jgi:hypothetical protein
MGPVMRRKERTRLIQGMGRCTRSATDFAVVLWLGQSLVDIASSKSAISQMRQLRGAGWIHADAAVFLRGRIGLGKR